MKSVLLIEDDEILGKLYREKFINEGFDFQVARSGHQGLDMIRKHKPQAILLDIMLGGGMNGFDVLEELKRNAEFKNTPVIVLTNLDTEKQVAKEIGAADYLVKAQVTPEQVVEKVKSYLE
jgi:DNA-binding response OmpR family regulator